MRREGNEEVHDLSGLVSRVASEADARTRPLESAATDDGPSFGSSSLLALEAAARRPPLPATAPTPRASRSSAAPSRTASASARRSGGSGRFRPDDFEGVTAIVVPHGNARFQRALLAEGTAESIRRFVDGGGVLVAVRGGAAALREKPLDLSKVTAWEPPPDPDEEPARDVRDVRRHARRPPQARTAHRATARDPEAALERDLERRPLPIPGAALRTQAMPGHPLLFGLAGSPAFLIVDGEPPLRLPEAKANVVTVAPDEPLLSGFGWKEALERWKGAAVVQLEESGRGRVVSFAADPVFRGVWRGSEVVFLNAVLLGPSLGVEGLVGSRALPSYSRRRRTTVRSSWNGTPAAKAARPSPIAPSISASGRDATLRTRATSRSRPNSSSSGFAASVMPSV